MKAFIILALVAVAAADVSHVVSRTGEADATINSQSSDVGPEGFQYGFDTSNGISGTASGVYKAIDKDQGAVVVEGRSAYTAPDGTPVQIEYTADENGYQPRGVHLPTPPPVQPIPDYILRSLQYIEAHPQKEEVYVKRA